MAKQKTAYVSARFALKEDVRKIHSQLEKMGYSISHDWTQHEAIRPYLEHQEHAKEYAILNMAGALKSNLFILLTDEAGTGMHSELGAVIAHSLFFDKPVIYVVGEHLNTNHFFFHPAVKRRKNIEEVFKELERRN